MHVVMFVPLWEAILHIAFALHAPSCDSCYSASLQLIFKAASGFSACTWCVKHEAARNNDDLSCEQL